MMFKNMFAGKNPQDVLAYLRRNNPQFDKFVSENDGKSAEEIAMEYDLDIDLLKRFL